MLLIGMLSVVLMMGSAALLIGGYLIAVHRARAAADLAALSAATAQIRGQDACAAAGSLALRHQARIVRCSLAGDQFDFVVTVVARISVEAALPGLPTRVEAQASSGPASLTGGGGR